MSKIIEWTPEQNNAWNQWVSSRPEIIQEMCKKLPPDRLYLYRPTGQRVTIYSYSENMTVTVSITGEYNVVTFEREVFGIDPDDLIECDLPSPDESVGTVLKTEEEINNFIALQKEFAK